MSVQFYPKAVAVDHSDNFCLDVSIFNAQGIFEMLNVKGTGEEGTIGSLTASEIEDALTHMQNFIEEGHWVNLGWDQDQMMRYVTKLNRILGFCLGNKCSFCLS